MFDIRVLKKEMVLWLWWFHINMSCSLKKGIIDIFSRPLHQVLLWRWAVRRYRYRRRVKRVTLPWRQNGWRWRVVFPSSGSLEEEEQVYTTFEGTANGNDLTTWTVLWFWDLAKPGVWFVCQKWWQKLVHVGCGLSRLFMCRNMKRLKGT